MAPPVLMAAVAKVASARLISTVAHIVWPLVSRMAATSRMAILARAAAWQAPTTREATLGKQSANHCSGSL